MTTTDHSNPNDYREFLEPYINAAKRIRPDLDPMAEGDDDVLVDIAIELAAEHDPTVFREFMNSVKAHLVRAN